MFAVHEPFCVWSGYDADGQVKRLCEAAAGFQFSWGSRMAGVRCTGSAVRLAVRSAALLVALPLSWAAGLSLALL